MISLPGAANAELHPSPRISNRLFTLLVLLIIGCAITRSAIATRVDGWTQDEGYHTVAGVSYVQRGDFRINPEHPPLVKLWVGAIVSATGFHLNPFRAMNDKADERDFVDEDMYLHNDADSVQRRTRIAMWSFNAILLAALAFALRRAFGPILALSVLLILAIDPTVAAHLPLVLTDLPISLLAAITIVLAGRAFYTWTWPDVALGSISMGLAFATKHSAPAFALLLAAAGLILALALPLKRPRDTRLLRLLKLSALFLGALVILWGVYRFRYTESSSPQEVFNRPLAQKISDLNSKANRFLLSKLSAAHLLPRAYLWGLADTVRAGVEGRAETRLFYGHVYNGNVTKLFFPGILAAKLPLGFLVLIFLGLYLFLARRLPKAWTVPAFVLLGVCAGFFLVLANGATYGGMRHALPAAVLLYILAGFALDVAWNTPSKALRAAVGIALAVAAISAVPVFRPYEYYNEIIGMKNAYLYFNDEGLDAEQRRKEMFKYYFEKVKPAGEIPYLWYDCTRFEAKARGFDYIGLDPKRDEERAANPLTTGTIFSGRWSLAEKPYWDVPTLRAATPAARFGNLFVYHGTFYLPGMAASDRYWNGLVKLYAEKPDPAEAERLFRQSAELDPNAFFVHIEIGNLALARGSREEALAAYRAALEHCPVKHPNHAAILEHIRRVLTEPLSQISPLRDPNVE
jgi:tetratricopeptide (TPR) repeat protein